MKKCEVCGKMVKQTDTHHILPRALGGGDEDTIEVCKACHSKMDRWIESFIVAKGEKREKWINHKKRREYQEKYMNQWQVAMFSPIPNWYIIESIYWNTRHQNIHYSSRGMYKIANSCKTHTKTRTLFSSITDKRKNSTNETWGGKIV